MIEGAHEKRIRSTNDEELIHLEPEMYEIIKQVRVQRQGNKKGGMHLMKSGSKKRKRTELGP